jgi:hypothetical protein
MTLYWLNLAASATVYLAQISIIMLSKVRYASGGFDCFIDELSRERQTFRVED